MDHGGQRLYNLNMHNSDYRTSIGKAVRRERLKLGLTQEELAERTDTHPSFIGQLERGVKAASLETLKRLSSVFGISSSDLLKESDAGETSNEGRSTQRKIIDLLKGYTAREQEAVYQTIKYILRQKRRLGK